MRRINSLRARMTLGFILILAPFLLVVGTALTFISSRLEADQTQAQLRQTAGAAKQVMMHPDWDTGLAKLAQSATLQSRGTGIEVLDDGQQVIWESSDNLPAHPLTDASHWEMADRHYGPYTILAMRPELERRARRDRGIAVLVILSLCVLLAVAAGAWAMVGRTLRPIHQLSQQAASGSAKNADAHLAPPSRDAELVELVGTLNGLLERQAQAAAAKGRFYAAASHELRTPLQALSGHLELALSRQRTADEYRDALAEAQGQAARLIALVRALLLLHQLEGPGRLPLEPTDLTPLCETALAQAAPRLAERGLSVESRFPEAAVIRAAPTHADILVRNLLENVCRYARPGGRAALTLSTGPRQTVLEVYNDSDLAEGDDPQHWLEPFHRPDPARAAEGGNGLGLAICRALAEANGWAMHIRREPDGVRVTVTFPPSAAPA